MNNYTKQLSDIVKEIQVTRDESGSSSLVFKGLKLHFNENFTLNDISSSTFQAFAEEIYKLYIQLQDDSELQDIEIEDLSLHKQRIQEDKFWEIEHQEKDGTVIARRNSERARIKSKYYYGLGNIKGKQNAEMISVITAHKIEIGSEEKSLVKKKKYSYIYVYGKNILRDEFSSDIIRFYFNLKPQKDHIIRWTATLINELNNREIPFHLKYLNNIQNYNRVDNCVLYVQKQNFAIVAQSIHDLLEIEENKAVLSQETPLFTRYLAPGLAFAESPLTRDESFGTQKSKEVLLAILKYLAHQKQDFRFDTEEFITYIVEHKLFDLKTPYLNPKTSYFYQYSIFAPDENKRRIKFLKYSSDNNTYLQAAQFFAKLIEQKAIWLQEERRTWITYTEKYTDEETKGTTNTFRPLDENERNGVEFFLETLEEALNQRSEKPEITNNLFEKIEMLNNENNYDKYLKRTTQKRFINLFTVNDQFDSIKETSNIKLINFVRGKIDKTETGVIINKSHKSDTGPFLAKNFANDEAIKDADDILEKFIAIGLPVRNRFSNFEFNPTITHGLAFYGYLFLKLYDNNVPNLNDEDLKKYLTID